LFFVHPILNRSGDGCHRLEAISRACAPVDDVGMASQHAARRFLDPDRDLAACFRSPAVSNSMRAIPSTSVTFELSMDRRKHAPTTTSPSPEGVTFALTLGEIGMPITKSHFGAPTLEPGMLGGGVEERRRCSGRSGRWRAHRVRDEEERQHTQSHADKIRARCLMLPE